jgi:hypothetical protein
MIGGAPPPRISKEKTTSRQDRLRREPARTLAKFHETAAGIYAGFREFSYVYLLAQN